MSSRYIEVENTEFITFKCPELGVISPKVCNDNCRILRDGKCPLEQK